MTDDAAARAAADACVEVAAGDGWLARRPGVLLWTPDAARPDVLLAAFETAPDAASAPAALTSAVLAAGLEVAPFVLVAWVGPLHVVVMGAVDVATDAPSLPLLSGATSRTWVEHRVPGATSTVVTAGTAPADGTDLEAGVVRAGGFRLTTAAISEMPPARLVERPPDALAAPDPPPAAVPEPPVVAAAGGAALLDLVTGGDWMDDSIGITAPGSLLEQDLEPETPTEPEGTGGAAVPARCCPSGHANPPGRATCERCGDIIDLTAPIVDVPQPALAVVTGDVDVPIEVAGTVVVGRRPDLAAAGADDDAERLIVADRPGVSRTHLVVRADGWTLTATDCGSRSGTELVRAGAEPVRLEPWAVHELQIGDRLYLGGPTSIRLDEPSAETSPSSP